MKDFLLRHGLKICIAIALLLLVVVVFLPAPSEGNTFARVWTIEEVRETYNTPDKLGAFIGRQFDTIRGINLVSPEEVLRTKEGNCKSLANFVKTILEPLGYDCQIMLDVRSYSYVPHTVCVVKDGGKYWIFSGVQYRERKRLPESLKGIMYMAKLKTLEEHEKEFQENYISPDELRRKPCGIACPECGAELLADYTTVLTSNPPQTPVYCPKCGWKGSIH